MTLSDGARDVDRYTVRTGFRTIAVQGDRLLVNGSPVSLRGFGRHEDFPLHGRGLDLAALVRDFELMTWTGTDSGLPHVALPVFGRDVQIWPIVSGSSSSTRSRP